MLYIFDDRIGTILTVLVCIPILVYLAYRILRNPFRYPYFIYRFDVSRKRNVNIEDYIDKFLCDNRNWHSIQSHEQYIVQWKRDMENYLNTCTLRKYRTRQYQRILDDNGAYRFETIRDQTRYVQQNYVRTPYTVSVPDSGLAVSWLWLKNRYKRLEMIGFEATLNEYNSKSQRKLMTKLLRKQIMERDHYTCRICGKYMPDEVGLHIDHIIPIARGGKTIPSNLRVLCSKCNGRKGAKYNDQCT